MIDKRAAIGMGGMLALFLMLTAPAAIDSELYTSSNLQYINSFVSNGYDTAFTMQNEPYVVFAGNCEYPPVTNVATSTVTTSGTFTETWNASVNTPYFNTLC